MISQCVLEQYSRKIIYLVIYDGLVLLRYLNHDVGLVIR
jgi:hypothetical protein